MCMYVCLGMLVQVCVSGHVCGGGAPTGAHVMMYVCVGGHNLKDGVVSFHSVGGDSHRQAWRRVL